MKIIFVIPDMAGGGTERVVSLLANEYVHRGIEVTILLFAGNRVEYPLNPKVEVVSVAFASRRNIAIIMKRVIRMRRFFLKNPQCRIFAFSTMGAFFSAIAAVGIPHYFLVSERNDPRRSPNKIWFRWAYGRADKVVFQTPDVARFFSDRVVGKSVVIPNPIDSSIPERHIGKREKKIVSVGRLQDQKNHELLLKAFADIYKKYSDYQLHIYGVGPLENYLKDLIDKLNIEHAVIWKGFSAHVREEIVDAKMYILSSNYEGLSNSMMEAMAIGVPVIATDCPIGGAKMLIENEVNGMLVPVGNIEKMAKAMERLIIDTELAEKISVNSVKIRDQYSIRKIADQFLLADRT